MATYEPLTPAQAEKRMRQCAARLLEAIEEHGLACEEEASAIADHKLAYASAYTRSTHDEKGPAEFHKAVAEQAAGDALRTMLVATAKRRALGEEMHSLRQVLSSIQTNARAMQAVS